MSSTVRPVLPLSRRRTSGSLEGFDLDRLGERLFRGQGPRGYAVIMRIGMQLGAREVLVVRRVGIVLGLKGQSIKPSVGHTALTDEGSIEVLTAIELDPRFGRLNQENAPT